MTIWKKKQKARTSLVVQWLRLLASTAGDTGSIPGPGTKIPYAMQCSQKKKKEAIPKALKKKCEESRT